MELIIGGVYQGKLKYAKEKYALTEEEIYTCSESQGIEFGRQCIDRAEEFTLWCVRNQKDPVEIFQAHRDQWADGIVICADIFCGVVPLGADMRKWRELTGNLCAYLSKEAETVTRLFCGLPQKLK